ncbi:DUF2218 domain-containing protein [Oryzicola mucosus]|uniref:DUF2218 domain-containing protein n=1 Tax=Oryzicola mucosus TaxID=2767425 RepID=A0A8J6U507_9HYPH|nr:DUF2218 domain-containing protein [Oryzicola mucosus]MBD0415405.1 DUF2218 domain-containing protein [Oryzicola mucosus]
MLQSVARVETPNSSKYLVQLSKHFGHKIEVTYTDTHADFIFGFGTAVLDADEKGLRMEVNTPDAEKLAQAQAVIESHLVRFAFREELGAFDWRQTDRAA